MGHVGHVGRAGRGVGRRGRGRGPSHRDIETRAFRPSPRWSWNRIGPSDRNWNRNLLGLTKKRVSQGICPLTYFVSSEP